jgi:hypothetical protein
VEEAPENGKELSHSAYGSGMDKEINFFFWLYLTREVDCLTAAVFLGRFAASSGNFLPTFRVNLLVLSL